MGITKDQSSNWQKLGELEAFGWILQDLGYLNERVKVEYFKRDRVEMQSKAIDCFLTSILWNVFYFILSKLLKYKD
jgi:hypothetical protein